LKHLNRTNRSPPFSRQAHPVHRAIGSVALKGLFLSDPWRYRIRGAKGAFFIGSAALKGLFWSDPWRLRGFFVGSVALKGLLLSTPWR